MQKLTGMTLTTHYAESETNSPVRGMGEFYLQSIIRKRARKTMNTVLCRICGVWDIVSKEQDLCNECLYRRIEQETENKFICKPALKEFGVLLLKGCENPY